MYKISEVLEFKDLPSELRMKVVSEEIIEGARLPLLFTQVFNQESLVGKDGRIMYFIKATQLSASAISDVSYDEPETTLASGLSFASEKTVTTVNVLVSDLIYCAGELSDVLSEDYPSVDWQRLTLKNMGLAIGEYIEGAIETVLESASGVVEKTVASISFGAVEDALAAMADNFWIASEDARPFLFVSPAEASYLLQDTTFVESRRYTTNDLEHMVDGEIGLYAGCRVMVHPALKDSSYAYIIFPSDTKYGTVGCLVWKRMLRTKSEYVIEKEKTQFLVSARVKFGVIQPLGICRIYISATP